MKAVPALGADGAVAAAPSRRWLVLAAAGVLIAACASKPPTDTTSTAETTAATAQELVSSDVDVVCRDVLVTGSHFPKRVCRTKKEWGQIEDGSRTFAQGLQSDSTHNLSPVPTGGVVNPTPIGGPPVY
jgi:hypothetical protein